MVRSLSGLEHATNLTDIDMFGSGIEDISPLASLDKLTVVRIQETENIRDISPLFSLNKLTSLNIGYTPIDPKWFSRFPNLAELYAECTLGIDGRMIPHPLEDLNYIASLKNLEKLNLGDNGISDLTPLTSLVNLKALGLWHNEITDISPVASLTNLTSLNLQGNKIIDIRPLVSLTNLSSLELGLNRLNGESLVIYSNLVSNGILPTFNHYRPTGTSNDPV